MLVDSLTGPVVSGLQKVLDLSWRRGQTIVSNVANAETPLYRAVDLNFGQELDRAFGTSNAELRKTNPSHLDIGKQSDAHLVADLSGATKPDGNNVDIDLQMGRLAYNSMIYTQAAAITQKKLSGLADKIRQVIA
jgi:flagellar basal-body rod protein FlgB